MVYIPQSVGRIAYRCEAMFLKLRSYHQALPQVQPVLNALRMDLQLVNQ